MNTGLPLSLWHFMHRRPRLLAGMAVGLLAVVLLWPLDTLAPVSKWLVGWNTGAWLYLGLVWRMAHPNHSGSLHWRQTEDEGAGITVLMVVLAAGISLWAIVGELGVARQAQGWVKHGHIALTLLTLVSSWLFMHVMFAMHYAHQYYHAAANGLDPGLSFPGQQTPSYGDFVYVACIIGTSGQTADVSFTTRRSRRIGTLHCVLAFFYNAAILALMINIAAGLL